MPFSPICLCGDTQGQHKMSKGGCRDCGCDRYEQDDKATADAKAEYEFDQRHSTEPREPVDTLSTSAHLAKAEHELKVLGADCREAREALYTTTWERDSARAELASARQEIELVRSAANEKVRAVLAAAAPGLARLIVAYDAWNCDRCGARYREPRTHACGPLTPITVALLRKPTEGAPTE